MSVTKLPDKDQSFATYTKLHSDQRRRQSDNLHEVGQQNTRWAVIKELRHGLVISKSLA